jgi:CHASE3 domain sensor protein
MLWTWVFVCLILGEIALYFILSTSKKVFPYEVTNPFKAKVFFYVLCVALLIMGGVSFFSYRDTQHRLRELDLLSNRLLAIGDLETTILRMESTQRGFLITGQKSYLDPYYRNKEKIPDLCESVKKLYQGTLDQRRAEEMCTLVNNRIIVLEKNIEIKSSGKKEVVEEALLFNEGKNTTEMIVLTGRDLEDRALAEYRNVMGGLWALGSVRVYMSFTLMIAALIQMVLAAILGRSKTPIQPSPNPETFSP